MADAILEEIDVTGTESEERIIYWEPLGGPAMLTGPAEGATNTALESVALLETETGWRARLTLPESITLPVGLRVGVSDNDLTYHTQWRTLNRPAGC